jgi:hypothetical protein
MNPFKLGFCGSRWKTAHAVVLPRTNNLLSSVGTTACPKVCILQDLTFYDQKAVLNPRRAGVTNIANATRFACSLLLAFGWIGGGILGPPKRTGKRVQ